jgi:hypothetical protein
MHHHLHAPRRFVLPRDLDDLARQSVPGAIHARR